MIMKTWLQAKDTRLQGRMSGRRNVWLAFGLLLFTHACSKPFLTTETQQSLKILDTKAGSTYFSTGSTINVMTYNIHAGKDRNGVDKLAEISDLIEGSGADIVALQEVDKNTVSSGGIDQLAWLSANTSGYSYYAFANHFDHDGGEYGLGILSKVPLDDIRNNRLTTRKAGRPNTTTAFLTVRALMPDGRKVAVACAHFSSDDKDEQAEEAIDFLRPYSNIPVFLAGDLNVIPSSSAMDILRGHFDDTEDRYSSPVTTYYTFPAHNVPDTTYRKKIDYVLVSKPHYESIDAREVIRVPNPTRDHHPFLATVSLKGNMFGSGNLLVMRYGNGEALGGQTARVYLDEYTTTGTLVQTLTLPATTTTIGGKIFNRRLTGIGSSTHEGLMTLSRDGQSVSLMGYDLAAGASVPSPIPLRTVALVTADGTINTYTATLTGIGSTRCVTSIDGTGFWAVGSKGNIRYLEMGLNGGAAVSLGGPSGSRSVYLYDNNGRLYLSTTVSGGPRIARVGTGSEPPTGGSPSINAFPGYPLTTTLPNQFAMFDTGTNNTPDKLYVVDNGSGAVLKYTYSSSQWVPAGSVSIPNAKSITGKINNGVVTLYVTTIGSASSLKKITNNANASLSGATVSTVVSAPGNRVFKSVAFVPQYPQ